MDSQCWINALSYVTKFIGYDAIDPNPPDTTGSFRAVKLELNGHRLGVLKQTLDHRKQLSTSLHAHFKVLYGNVARSMSSSLRNAPTEILP